MNGNNFETRVNFVSLFYAKFLCLMTDCSKLEYIFKALWIARLRVGAQLADCYNSVCTEATRNMKLAIPKPGVGLRY